MARISNKEKKKKIGFQDKLVLNLFLISLFGIDPLLDQYSGSGSTRRKVRPFRKLSEKLDDCRTEGLADDGLHHFYHQLSDGDFFAAESCRISRDQLREYEENLVRHTAKINGNRQQPIHWKYYQWLSLLFVEIYLDRYFGNRKKLLGDLNEFVADFNRCHSDELPMEGYQEEDLNKLCLQNATGSGKTLLMVVNYLQFKYYEAKYGKLTQDNGLTLLISPNERLSGQDAEEFNRSGFFAAPYSRNAGDQNIIYTLEVQKLKEKDGDKSVNTASLGNQNLLLIDEGHAGLSSDKEESAWFDRRSMLCERGFVFEYSATFKQAAEGTRHEDNYARAVLFDYSYRWFYEDGYGKDYQIFNIPKEQNKGILDLYLSGGLLKFYQQLLIYEDKKSALYPFNIEKPLWVWVGHSVGGKGKEEKAAMSDIGRILLFIAEFLKEPEISRKRITDLLTKSGAETGLMDSKENDLFAASFAQLKRQKEKLGDMDGTRLYAEILEKLFQSPRKGHLVLERVKGDSGEILLRVSSARQYFGLINVSGAKELCDYLEQHAEFKELIEVRSDSDYAVPMFDDVKRSDSTINLLIGAKKFIEGWDCWRVSTLGMLNVGKSEGAQIIQLFGRGVRLKGYRWSLKRSSYVSLPKLPPDGILELELLNVFGVSADAMEKFKNDLTAEGLPGNESRQVITVPLTICDLNNKKLKVPCAKKRRDNGRAYEFKTDGPVPCLGGDIPESLIKNKVELDWYPRIQSLTSDGSNAQLYQGPSGKYADGNLCHLAEFLDFEELYFEVEHWKRQQAKYNLNCTVDGLRELFSTHSWYTLLMPRERLTPQSFRELRELRDVAKILLRKYTEKFYAHCSEAYMRQRTELRIVDYSDGNIPMEQEYQIIFDNSDEALRSSVNQMLQSLRTQPEAFSIFNNMCGFEFGGHLFNPLFFSENSKIKIEPCRLNTTEFRFVRHLAEYTKAHQDELKRNWGDIYLLRNQGRGKGLGFFEASNFYPDFILWCVKGEKQFITFVEPHGLKHEGPASPKVCFAETVKDIQTRLGDPNVILNSFILSKTTINDLSWGLDASQMSEHHILFQEEHNGDIYLEQLFQKLSKDNAVKIPNEKRKTKKLIDYGCQLFVATIQQANGSVSLDMMSDVFAAIGSVKEMAAMIPESSMKREWMECLPDFPVNESLLREIIDYLIKCGLVDFQVINGEKLLSMKSALPTMDKWVDVDAYFAGIAISNWTARLKIPEFIAFRRVFHEAFAA